MFSQQGAYFFPPDPTETTASLGGMVACNASGARSFYYGSTRKFIHGLDIILADGAKLHVCRGKQRSQAGRFSLAVQAGEGGKPYTLSGRTPSYSKPAGKNAAGYFSGPDIDLIDLFIGSEGTLGIISQIELKLIPLPEFIWAGLFFFFKQEQAIQFVNVLRKDNFLKEQNKENTHLSAIEFFDNRALALVTTLPASEYPPPPKQVNAALYIEVHGRNEERISQCFLHIAELMAETGENPELNSR